MLQYAGHRALFPLITTMVVMIPPLWLLSSAFALLRTQIPFNRVNGNIDPIDRSRTNLSSCPGTYTLGARFYAHRNDTQDTHLHR
jgi:hypothetical protein